MPADRLRLLVCHTCATIQELPWYEGPPERDDTLNYRLSSHCFPDGSAHFGVMATVAAEDWAKPAYQDAISLKIAEAAGRPGSGEGLGSSFYDIKANFADDAMSCWKQHNRTQNCDDYMSDGKRLYPDTRADRRSEGLDPKERPNTWLCQFCVVHSLVTSRKRKAAGAYDKKNWE